MDPGEPVAWRGLGPLHSGGCPRDQKGRYLLRVQLGGLTASYTGAAFVTGGPQLLPGWTVLI